MKLMWNILKIKKNKLLGFSLVEIMATVTLIAITSLVVAPSYVKTQQRDTFRSGTQTFFDYLILARNSAMTNKKCTDGSVSDLWRVDLILNDNTGSDYTAQLKCIHDGTTEEEEKTVQTLENGDIYLMDFDGTETSGSSPGHPTVTHISFYSVSGLPKIEYGNSAPPSNRVNDMTIVFKFELQDYFQTICFNRIAGYPTLNKSGQTCNDY